MKCGDCPYAKPLGLGILRCLPEHRESLEAERARAPWRAPSLVVADCRPRYADTPCNRPDRLTDKERPDAGALFTEDAEAVPPTKPIINWKIELTGVGVFPPSFKVGARVQHAVTGATGTIDRRTDPGVVEPRWHVQWDGGEHSSPPDYNLRLLPPEPPAPPALKVGDRVRVERKGCRTDIGDLGTVTDVTDDKVYARMDRGKKVTNWKCDAHGMLRGERWLSRVDEEAAR